MRVRIGPYKNWFGPYQLADILKHIGIDEDKCYDIGKRLSETWVARFLTWVDSKRHRTVKVHIDPWDSWNADTTIALVVLPILKQLKETKHGSPFVNPEDVPEELRDTPADLAAINQSIGEVTEKHWKRWDWVLDEIIFAFERKCDDSWEDEFYKESGEYEFVDSNIGSGYKEMKWTKEPVVDREGLKATQERIANGFKLFGLYYQNLWD